MPKPHPLCNKRIVITRAREQSAHMIAMLQAAGAVPIAYPTVAFEPLPQAGGQIAQAVQQTYDWLLLTSQNGVRFFFDYLPSDVQFRPSRIGVSGPKTAAKLAQYGRRADVIPSRFVGESLVDTLGDIAGKHILLPRAKQGRPKLITLLRERGAHVTEIALYDTVCPPPDAAGRAQIEQGVDLLTFASPSAVRGFMQRHGTTIGTAQIACIGPITARYAKKHGLPVHIMPKTYTIDGLLAAIVNHYHV